MKINALSPFPFFAKQTINRVDTTSHSEKPVISSDTFVAKTKYRVGVIPKWEGLPEYGSAMEALRMYGYLIEAGLELEGYYAVKLDQIGTIFSEITKGVKNIKALKDQQDLITSLGAYYKVRAEQAKQAERIRLAAEQIELKNQTGKIREEIEGLKIKLVDNYDSPYRLRTTRVSIEAHHESIRKLQELIETNESLLKSLQPSNVLNSSEPIDAGKLQSLIEQERLMFSEANSQREKQIQQALNLNKVASLKRQLEGLEIQEAAAKNALLKIQKELKQCQMEINDKSRSNILNWLCLKLKEISS